MTDRAVSASLFKVACPPATDGDY